MSSLILPAEQLKAELAALGFKTPDFVRDKDCLCPSADFLDDMCLYIKDHVWVYLPDKSDCDDAAFDLVVLASRALAKSRVNNVGHAVCFCQIIITEGATLNNIGGGGHCTTIVRTPDGWKFLERESGTYEDAATRINDGSVTPGFAMC